MKSFESVVKKYDWSSILLSVPFTMVLFLFLKAITYLVQQLGFSFEWLDLVMLYLPCSIVARQIVSKIVSKDWLQDMSRWLIESGFVWSLTLLIVTVYYWVSV